MVILRDWNSDVQLVIDAGNQVQVWNSPLDYEEQVEAGVTSAVTITETGWLVEVGIDKDVFDIPLPAPGPRTTRQGIITVLTSATVTTTTRTTRETGTVTPPYYERLCLGRPIQRWRLPEQGGKQLGSNDCWASPRLSTAISTTTGFSMHRISTT